MRTAPNAMSDATIAAQRVQNICLDRKALSRSAFLRSCHASHCSAYPFAMDTSPTEIEERAPVGYLTEYQSDVLRTGRLKRFTPFQLFINILLPWTGCVERKPFLTQAHFFVRRRVVAFFEGVALSIRKSSSFLPSLIAAVSHLGVAPRPAHVSPPAPRYFGATFFPFNLLPRVTRATLPPTEAIEPPSAANCFSSVVRRSERAFSTCLRKVMSEAKSIRDRLILATAMLQ